MDEKVVTAIHELSNALAGLGSWQQQLVSMAILLVVAAGGSFFGAYLKTRASNAAMSDDLDAIKRQLAATTHTTKSIEAQISKRGELHSLRVKKLEELMEAFLTACEFYRAQFEIQFQSGAKLGLDQMPHQRAVALAKFYFPELDDSLRSAIVCWRIAVSEAASERLTVDRNTPHPDIAIDRMLDWRETTGDKLAGNAMDLSDAFQIKMVRTMHDLLAEGEAQKEAGRPPA